MSRKPKLTALELAVENAGSQSKLAQKVGCKQQSISQWLKRGPSAVPAEVAVSIEAANLGVTRADLRPDLYGELEAAQ